MNLKTAWKEAVRKLKEAGVQEPELDAWYLLEYAAGISRAAYYLEPERKMTPEQNKTFQDLLEKRMQRIPLQHLTGMQEFMGYEFLVNEHVLIPRQDTETLVEEAEKLLQSGMRILDLCTGSGCILISLLKLAEERGLKDVCGTGTDISEAALEVAVRNANKLLGSACAKFLKGNLLDPIAKSALSGANAETSLKNGLCYDMILSNPPYIRTAEIDALQQEVRVYDPYIALDGGEDGLFFYREIIRGAPRYLKAGGVLLLEIGSDQGQDVSRLMRNAGFSDVAVKKDLAGLDRVISGVYDKR